MSCCTVCILCIGLSFLALLWLFPQYYYNLLTSWCSCTDASASVCYQCQPGKLQKHFRVGSSICEKAVACQNTFRFHTPMSAWVFLLALSSALSLRSAERPRFDKHQLVLHRVDRTRGDCVKESTCARACSAGSVRQLWAYCKIL